MSDRTKFNILVPVQIIDTPQKEYRATASMVPLLSAQPDLLYMKSLLASTGSNKNDDVFLREELWKARSSPILKPVDWEHNTGRELTDEELSSNPNKMVADNQIIGVMYNAYATDENGVIISEEATSAADFEIPESFHVVDEAVIYKGLFPKTAARIERGAARNELFVSMEAWFSGYDYLVGNKVIARNEETAFLESKLRANGGNGTLGMDKVRRILRNIVFGGKGIVERPANEPSVIQSVTHAPISSEASLNKTIASNIIGEINETGLITEESNTMANETNNIPTASTSGPSFDDYKAVTQELAETRVELKSTASSLETTKVERDELKTREENLTTAISKGGSVLEAALPGISDKLSTASVSEVFDVIADAVKAQGVASATKVEDAEKKATEANNKLADFENRTRAAERLSQIQAELNLGAVEGDSEISKARLTHAQKIADETKTLDDKAFASRLEGLKTLLSVAKAPPFGKKGEEDEDKDKKKKKEEAKADEGITDATILNHVQASESVPAGNDKSGEAGLDLNKAYAGLVGQLLSSNAEETNKA